MTPMSATTNPPPMRPLSNAEATARKIQPSAPTAGAGGESADAAPPTSFWAREGGLCLHACAQKPRE
jgi:hypothetical protein